MKDHWKLSDTEFEEEFKSTNLSFLFNHEAHLRLAWIHLRKKSLEEAIQIIDKQLQAYVQKVAAKDKYNKTLTIAAIKVTHHFYCKSDSESFQDFIDRFPRLLTNFKELIAAHYHLDIYNSIVAKHKYIEPDRRPF